MSTEALELLKLTLNHEIYEQYKGLFLNEMFSRPVDKLWKVIQEAHNKYKRDLSTAEVYALVVAKNGTLTTAMKNSLKDVLDRVEGLPEIGSDVALEVIKSAYLHEYGRQIIEESYNLVEGKPYDTQKIKSVLDSIDNGIPAIQSKFEEVSTNLEELLAEVENGPGWHFNIPNLHRRVPVVHPGEFMIAFALVEAGKTGFWISLACSSGGWCDQGAKVTAFCNEEYAKRNMVRAISCASSMSAEEMKENISLASKRSELVRDRIHMLDTQDWGFEELNAYCLKEKPDIVIIDQLDKVRFTGSKDAPTHEKLGWIYNQARELAKRHHCFVVGISQASNDAQNHDVIDFSMLAGSKVAKPAEADLIIGIGHNGIVEQAGGSNNVNFRLLTISKNKCSGYHGSIACRLDPLRSTFHDCEQI